MTKHSQHERARRAEETASVAQIEARPQMATIDLTARAGRGNFAIGDRVRIAGSGLYSGESAVIVTLASGVIPAADVRTEGGFTRRVRTIGLERISDMPAPPTASQPQPAPSSD